MTKKRSLWAWLLLAVLLLVAGCCLLRHRRCLADRWFFFQEKLRARRLQKREYADFADVAF